MDHTKYESWGIVGKSVWRKEKEAGEISKLKGVAFFLLFIALFLLAAYGDHQSLMAGLL